MLGIIFTCLYGYNKTISFTVGMLNRFMKYFKKQFTILAIFLVVVVFFAACIKDAPDDFDNPESTWNPSFSFPVGYTSLGMNEDSGFDTLLLLIDAMTGSPFWIEEIDIPLIYTMPFDMQELSEFSEEIISVMFRLNFYNGFPAVAKAQIYFLDINDQVIDSLFSNESLLINPGVVVGNGETVNKNHYQTDVVFSQDKINNLSTVRNVLIHGGIQNLALDTTLIEYYPKYSLDIQMGLQVELNMSIASK